MIFTQKFINNYEQIQDKKFSGYKLKVKRQNDISKLILHPLNITKYQENHADRHLNKYLNRMVTKCSRYIHINHPNVEEIIDIFTYQRKEKICIAFVGEIDHQNLSDFIQSKHSFNRKIIKSIMLDMVSGLEQLHRRNIIYQNFSLYNVQRESFENTFKLKFTSFREIENFNGGPTKCYYNAPEMFNEEGYGMGADIWSLAIIFIEVLARQSFQNLQQTSFPCNDSQFPSQKLLQKGPNSNIRTLLRQMLSKEPKMRPTVFKVREYLENIDLVKEDSEDQEQIQEHQLLVYFSIPLLPFKNMKAKRKNCLNVLNFNKSKEKLVCTKENSQRQLQVSITFCIKLNMLEICAFNKSKKLVYSSIMYQNKQFFELCPMMDKYFNNLKQFVHAFMTISPANMSITETGNLKIGVNSQNLPFNEKQQQIFEAKDHFNRPLKNQTFPGRSDNSVPVYKMDELDKKEIIFKLKINNSDYEEQIQPMESKKIIFKKVMTPDKYDQMNQIHALAHSAFQSENYKQAAEYFMQYEDFIVYSTNPQLQQVCISYNLAICLIEMKQFSRANQKCLKIEKKMKEFDFSEFNSHKKLQIQRISLAIKIFGLYCSHVCDHDKEQIWLKIIQKSCNMQKSNQIKILAYYKVMQHFFFLKQQQVAYQYLSLINSLIDMEVVSIKPEMIQMYQNVGILLLQIDPRNLQISLNLFSKVINTSKQFKMNQQINFAKLLRSLQIMKTIFQENRLYQLLQKLLIWMEENQLNNFIYN